MYSQRQFTADRMGSVRKINIYILKTHTLLWGPPLKVGKADLRPCRGKYFNDKRSFRWYGTDTKLWWIYRHVWALMPKLWGENCYFRSHQQNAQKKQVNHMMIHWGGGVSWGHVIHGTFAFHRHYPVTPSSCAVDMARMMWYLQM